jgi:acyl-CoA thioesterase YciA
MTKQQPEGELVIQTLAMPKDTNGHGDIFGGWLISQMDLGAAIFAMKVAKKLVTTVAINEMVFKKPVRVGDGISCYARLIKIGNTSLTLHMEAWSQDFTTHSVMPVAEGVFTFVALDAEKKPIPVLS